MKITKWITAVFAVAVLMSPAFAQYQDPHFKEYWKEGKHLSTAIERAAIKAAQEHKSSVCSQCGEAYTIDEKYHGLKHECAATNKNVAKNAVCCRCGEEIKPGQHCAAAGYIALCTASEPNTAAPEVHAVADCCPQCGKAYTIDEKYHGLKHECAKQQEEPRYCIYCGELIKNSNQKCAASKRIVCTTSCPDCGANLRDSKNLSPDGVHHCRFKTRIKPAAPKITPDK